MTGHNGPAGGDRPEEEPVPDARRLQEELEAARKAGQAVPYETLAALAASVGDLRSQVRFVHSVVDRSGLAFAKDTRALVLRLTATVDAMDAKLAGLAQAVQDLQDSGSRVCAPNWAAMDQATRAAELARLSEWVARVLLPGYRVEPPLRPCWRAHLPWCGNWGPSGPSGAGCMTARHPSWRARSTGTTAGSPAPWSAPSAPCPGVRSASASWPPARRPGIPRKAVQSQLYPGPPSPTGRGSSCAWLTVRWLRVAS